MRSGFTTTDVADLENGGSRLTNVRHFTVEESVDYELAWMPDQPASRDHFVVSFPASAFSNFRRRTANDLATLETSSYSFVRFRSAVGSSYSPPGETRSVIMATGESSLAL